jgi:hypothetical protein
MFTAPNQLIYTDNDPSEDIQYFGFTLFFHPDFIRNYSLGRNIKRYGFSPMIPMRRCIYQKKKKDYCRLIGKYR